MISSLRELVSGGPVLTDGALGTWLQAHGLEIGVCPDAWNLVQAQLVEQLARAYVEAGSRIILTNTFRANGLSLARHGLAEKAAQINQAGVTIARRAAAGRAYVFGSVGPTGRLLLTGETSEAEVKTAYREQAKTLAEAGVDAFVMETMSDLQEATLAVAAARETHLPVVACMTFDSGKHQDRTMMGATPEQVAKELTAAGADAVGANCGQGIAGYVSICARLHAATDRPIWIKPNAGMPEMVEGRAVYKTTPEEFAAYAPALLEAGVSFLGGCCGTGPEFIRALARALPKLGSA
jgi:methionine synthase I (cobalamin-dependent)